jgi:hypothetical protein
MAGAVVPLIIGILNAASVIVPALTEVSPIIQKGLSGEPYSAADIEALQAASDKLDAQVSLAEAAAELPPATA